MTQTVLILGASGRFGRNAAQQFRAAGWHVRIFDRTRDQLNTAAQGADVIVNAWNPFYPDWAEQVPKLHAQVIKAAELSKATVIVPGNVYVFGPQAPLPWSGATPHLATNPLGQIRMDMEEAYKASTVRTIVLRAGDFIDTEASGNWFDQILTKHLSKGRLTYPGNPHILHAWAYLPDLCRAAVELAEMRHELPRYADIPFAGFTLSGEQLVRGLAEVLGKDIRIKKMSWLPLQVARPFWPLAKYLLEMRYLWDTPHALDGTMMADLLPNFRETPVEVALAAAVPADLVQTQIHPNQPVPARL
jgi:nucleoside-diphosphate-sugar epimerase